MCTFRHSLWGSHALAIQKLCFGSTMTINDSSNVWYVDVLFCRPKKRQPSTINLQYIPTSLNCRWTKRTGREKKKRWFASARYSSCSRFRSEVLRVMSPARFRCAKQLLRIPCLLAENVLMEEIQFEECIISLFDVDKIGFSWASMTLFFFFESSC